MSWESKTEEGPLNNLKDGFLEFTGHVFSNSVYTIQHKLKNILRRELLGAGHPW